MDKLRKVGIWLWDVKERVVLALMVILLGYRVYTLVNAEEDLKKLSLKPPGNPVVNVDPPPRVPDQPSPEPVIRLVRRSPFAYVSPSSRASRTESSGDNKDDDVRVLRIVEVTGGVYRAQITTGGAAKTIAEGGSFESYQLKSIDPDTGCCIIYSENSNSEIERCIEEN